MPLLSTLKIIIIISKYKPISDKSVAVTDIYKLHTLLTTIGNQCTRHCYFENKKLTLNDIITIDQLHTIATF